jgi:glycolate oxidase FAD binding subunit
MLCLNAEPSDLAAVVNELRNELQSRGGSLVTLHRPTELTSIDAWGDAGDSVPLMRAVKHQLDPKNTLNPGRFVGGI